MTRLPTNASSRLSLLALLALGVSACSSNVVVDSRYTTPDDEATSDETGPSVDPGTDDDGEPAVTPPGETMVRVHYDTGMGSEITLRGEGAGLDWESGAPCTWSTGNVWTCGPFDLTETATVKPLVNDADWALGYNFQIEPGTTADLYPSFYDTTGRIETWTFQSEVLGNVRDVAVYLPPSYDENTAKRYPILFMHDGQNLFDPSLSAFGVSWEIDETSDVLDTWYGVREYIVVAPYNNGDRIWEYTPSYDASIGDGGGADLYLDFLVDEVLPWVEDTYRTDGDRLGIAGSSLGGLLSLHACWTRPTVFSRCGVFSPSLWWDDGALLSAIESSNAPRTDVRFYVDSGDSGPSQDGKADTMALRDALVDHGWVIGDDLKYVLGAGQAHNEAAWAARAPDALAFLYDDPTRSAP